MLIPCSCSSCSSFLVVFSRSCYCFFFRVSCSSRSSHHYSSSSSSLLLLLLLLPVVVVVAVLVLLFFGCCLFVGCWLLVLLLLLVLVVVNVVVEVVVVVGFDTFSATCMRQDQLFVDEMKGLQSSQFMKGLPWDSYRILLYAWLLKADCEVSKMNDFELLPPQVLFNHNPVPGNSRKYALLGGWVGACWFQWMGSHSCPTIF